MAKFFGKVGFGIQTELSPGVWDDVITEKSYSGDVTRNSRQSIEGEKINNDLAVENSIEILADAFASENFFAIRYVEWVGVLWTVPNVVVQRPRLILRIGGKYNGRTPDPTPTS